MKKQISIRLQVSEKNYVYIIIMLLVTISFACQKEISTSIEPNTPPAPAQIKFQKTYGGINAEELLGGDVQPTKDSGYIIIGSTTSYAAGDEDIYVVKTDSTGKILWTKTYGGADHDEGYYIKQTTDEGYILGGDLGGPFAGFNLIKIDNKGNVQWAKAYDGVGSDDVQQTSDGGYIVAGPATGFSGIQLIKTDNNGNIIWSMTYEGGNGGPIVQTSDGGYAVTGFTNLDPGSGWWGILLLKINSTGNLLWAKTYGGVESYNPSSMRQTADGGFIISGGIDYQPYVVGNTDGDACLIKTDASGNLVWSKTYGSNNLWEAAVSTEQTTDGGYILSGLTGAYGNGYALVVKTDNTGNVSWSKIYGGGTETYSYVHQTRDQGYISVSTTSSFGAGNRDIYLIKTDDKGNSGCHESSFTPIVTTPAIQVTSLNLVFYPGGGTILTPSFIVGSGGTSSTLCYK